MYYCSDTQVAIKEYEDYAGSMVHFFYRQITNGYFWRDTMTLSYSWRTSITSCETDGERKRYYLSICKELFSICDQAGLGKGYLGQYSLESEGK